MERGRTTSNEDIARMKKQLEQHEKRISKLERTLKPDSTAKKKRIAIKEFVLSKKPKNDVQRTLAIGYYLERYDGMSSFNTSDLKKGFRSAKEKVPINVGDKVNKNIEKGHMMEAEEEKDNLKAWVLTNSGERYVENDFKKK